MWVSKLKCKYMERTKTEKYYATFSETKDSVYVVLCAEVSSSGTRQ